MGGVSRCFVRMRRRVDAAAAAGGGCAAAVVDTGAGVWGRRNGGVSAGRMVPPTGMAAATRDAGRGDRHAGGHPIAAGGGDFRRLCDHAADRVVVGGPPLVALAGAGGGTDLHAGGGCLRHPGTDHAGYAPRRPPCRGIAFRVFPKPQPQRHLPRHGRRLRLGQCAASPARQAVFRHDPGPRRHRRVPVGGGWLVNEPRRRGLGGHRLPGLADHVR